MENSPKKMGWTAAASSTVSRDTVASTELSDSDDSPEARAPETVPAAE